MGTLYVQAGGGLGDFIHDYLLDYKWRILPNVKRLYPDCMITAVIACHNPSVAELIYTNPHIDGIMTYPWYPPGHKMEKAWHHLVTGADMGEWARSLNIKEAGAVGLMHKVHLTDKEEKLIAEIRAKNPKYIVVHPFAGMPHRGCKPHPIDGKYKCFPDYKYAQVMNYLASLGHTVVLVGRTSYDGQDILRGEEETFEVPITLHENVINLINKVSVRVNVELCRRANGFIGAHSSMLSAAWTANTPSVFFYPGTDEHGNIRTVTEHGGHTGTWALDRPYHNYYEMSPEAFLDLNPLAPAQLLLEHLR